MVGLHLTPPLAAPDPATFADLTPAEQASLEPCGTPAGGEDGYSAEQSTKPQTIGYSLVDSPAGLAAWIVEKFRTWSDCDGLPEQALDRDRMLDDITLYWLTGTGASAARLYWESIREVQEIFTSGTGDSVTVPAGGSISRTRTRVLPPLGGAPIRRHPLLERARPRRPLRRLGAAGAVRRRGARVLPAGALSSAPGASADPRGGRVGLHLAGGVLGARPEEARAGRALGPGHDMDVQVGDRLADTRC